jgi:hypothetical protein
MWPVKYVAKVSYLPLPLDSGGKPVSRAGQGRAAQGRAVFAIKMDICKAVFPLGKCNCKNANDNNSC